MRVPGTGIWLVVAQFALCITLLILGAPGLRDHPWLWAGIAAGCGIAGAGVAAIRASRVRLTPEPGADAELCERGIYGWIRHPMYAGVLLAFGMCALASGTGTGGVLWLALAGVLGMKARIEERLWTSRHAGYAAYARRTKRLIPGIW